MATGNIKSVTEDMVETLRRRNQSGTRENGEDRGFQIGHLSTDLSHQNKRGTLYETDGKPGYLLSAQKDKENT
ncbi:hypothetical protein KUCAC02_024789 [Chaenocephalus aceratus]|nr:hypothetical protein KUCAC02_024789 [Chaenocephalus aceratus]